MLLTLAVLLVGSSAIFTPASAVDDWLLEAAPGQTLRSTTTSGSPT